MGKKYLAFVLPLMLGACASINTQPLVGDWNGTLATPVGDLRVVFHFTETENGYTCTLDSLDQGANNIPCGEVTTTDDLVNVTVPVVMGGYVGTINGDVITGEWTQGGFTLGLDLTRAQ